MKIRQSPSGAAVKLPSFDSVPGNVNTGAVASIDWSKGPAQRLTLDASATVSMVGLPAGEPTWVQLSLIQAGAGSNVPTFTGAKTPGGLALTLSTTVGAHDIISGYWSGTTLYLSVAGLAFA